MLLITKILNLVLHTGNNLNSHNSIIIKIRSEGLFFVWLIFVEMLAINVSE